MDIADFRDSVMQSAETLRRAAERSVRNLRDLEQGDGAAQARVQEYLDDLRADLASLTALQKTADILLREGIEAEALLRYCEVVLEAASTSMKGATVVATARTDVVLAEPQTLVEIKATSQQAQAVHAYFKRLVEWLHTPFPPLPEAAVERLNSLPPMAHPQSGKTPGAGDLSAAV